MGAATFSEVGYGATAREAFDAVVAEAHWEHGHGGYTGTVGEKNSFALCTVSDELLAQLQLSEYYEWADDAHWKEFDDKWGPAGCVDLKDGRYLFFGWASC